MLVRGLPYVQALITVWLAHRFYQDHRVQPGPDVLPAASEAPYYLLLIWWWLVQLTLFPIALVLLVVLRVRFKQSIGAPLAFFLLGVLLMAINWVSSFSIWLAD